MTPLTAENQLPVEQVVPVGQVGNPPTDWGRPLGPVQSSISPVVQEPVSTSARGCAVGQVGNLPTD